MPSGTNENVLFKFLVACGSLPGGHCVNSTTEDSNRPHNCTSDSQQNDDVCWKLLFFSVCPAVSVLSALLSVLVYRICQKSATSSQNSERKENSRNLTRHTQEKDEDVCYAALEIQQSSMKPQRKRTTTQTSDFSTYSTVNKL
ncbi:uncharacterized protein LOC105354044 isoform X2 [Oryzias latipes]|uniref:uncharacterized protein LOC105354044 isoform X2 n=1 Tax=Oryzias latipes TaxID=8090 RepID=UPI000CE1D424|nr:uncharacterized protein LOC105354044 isoform X2 [Oryzias latipes]